MKKVLFFIAMGVILNGCTQYSSFLGPTYTIATTGNVYQAGLYYQSSSLIKKKTGKNTFEHALNLIEKSSKEINLDENLTVLVKSNIRETKKKFFLDE